MMDWYRGPHVPFWEGDEHAESEDLGVHHFGTEWLKRSVYTHLFTYRFWLVSNKIEFIHRELPICPF